jgi:membrane protein
MIILKIIYQSLIQAIINLVDHDGIEHAGYMAFISLLALFPFFVFFIALAGFIGQLLVGEFIVQYILNNMPYDISVALKPRIIEIISTPPQNLLNLAILGTIWTSSSFVEGLRTILNRVYKVRTPPAYILRRCLSIVQFIILVSVILGVILLLLLIPVLWHKLPNFMPHFLSHSAFNIASTVNYLKYIVMGLSLFTFVAALYYILPNKSLSGLYVFPGALLVILLWFAAGGMLSLYLKHFKQLDLIYGSLQGIIISLLFFYTINIIFILGAEFNYLFAHEIHKTFEKTSS